MNTIIDSWGSFWNQINGTPAPGSTPTQPGLLLNTMGAARVAQKVFLNSVQGNDSPVPADTIDPNTGIATVGVTRPMVSITKQFQLVDLHVNPSAAPGLPMVLNQVSLSAQALALAEDKLFFQGKDAKLPPGVNVANPADLQGGLLGIAKKEKIIQVKPDGKGWYGPKTYEAVVEGISLFSDNYQAGPFALILHPSKYADANYPFANTLVAPAAAIQSLVQDFYMSPGLPEGWGLLAAGAAGIVPTGSGPVTPLTGPPASPTAGSGANTTTGTTASTTTGSATSSTGGATTNLIVGTAPIVEYTNTDGKYYYFTVRESIQFYNTDARSLIAFEFKA
jgi:hypothetical protein